MMIVLLWGMPGVLLGAGGTALSPVDGEPKAPDFDLKGPEG
jgi:hypothetical protein